MAANKACKSLFHNAFFKPGHYRSVRPKFEGKTGEYVTVAQILSCLI